MPDEPKHGGLPTDFQPLTDEAWPPSLEAMRASFATDLNVYRVMAHHPALLRAWRDFRDHVVRCNSLDPASLEIVILRTAFRRGCSYEWAHHVVRARSAGLGDRRIASAALSPDQTTSATDVMLMRCVDALIDTNRLPNTLQAELVSQFGKEGVLDLMATVGMYSLLAYILESFATPVDAGILATLELAPLAT